MRVPTEKLLPALHGVRRAGAGRWSAICPAHDDRRPSLSVRELDDGRVLVHCWAGCDAHSIVASVGLDLSDLFPPTGRDRQPGAGRPPVRRPWVAADLLRLASFEATVVVIIAADLAAGRDADRGRLVEAAARLADLAEAAHAR